MSVCARIELHVNRVWCARLLRNYVHGSAYTVVVIDAEYKGLITKGCILYVSDTKLPPSQLVLICSPLYSFFYCLVYSYK